MLNPNNLCPGCMNEKVTEGKCPICGYNPEEAANPSYLAPGTTLDARYVIGKVIDTNGEGVTYLGFDTVTAVTVNIREFFPQGLCERDVDKATVLMLSGCEYNYNDALTKFTELSRELFKLNELPALFDVLDIRESNNTAYRITRAVPGISLREFLMRNGGILKWDQARSLFAPLVSSISALHGAGIVHRGISPDTLIVGKDGKLRLNGFCIPECRTAKSALTSQLFPGFAAVEQYGVAGTQGPWTDIYAFAATIYRTLVGNPPPEATQRLESDNMTIPAKIARETPKAVLETLANALQVLPNDRTQNIDSMRRGLSISSAQLASQATTVLNVNGAAGTGSAPIQRPSANTQSGNFEQQNSKSNTGKKKKGSTGKMYGLVAGIVTAFLLIIVLFFVLWITGYIGGDDKDAASSTDSNSAGFITSIPSDVEASKDSVTGEESIELPNFAGHLLTDIVTNSSYKDYVKFEVVSKVYSEEYAAGFIVSHSPAQSSNVKVGTTVEVVVSLGPQMIEMPDIYGMDELTAKFTLMQAGFENYNIVRSPAGKYDPTKPALSVIQTDPVPGTRVKRDTIITLTFNTYTGIEELPPDQEPGNNSSVNDQPNLGPA